jgi:threonine dehydrogenase-like Zn-dependent dehydrogenase
LRATVMHGAGDVRIEDVLDAGLPEPTDAVVRVLRACICGSDLWPYASVKPSDEGRRIGHEFIGVIEDLGSDVSGFARGDLVVAPFVWSDGTCDFCQEGLHTPVAMAAPGRPTGSTVARGEAVRVPLAQGTLVKLPVSQDDALLPSLLTLSDVFPTGHDCAVTAGVSPRTTVTVIGDGAVGLSAVLAAKRLGAEQIILMGRHPQRTDLGREFGATDVVAERGNEGAARVRELSARGRHPSGAGVRRAQAGAGDRLRGRTRRRRHQRVGAPQYPEVPADFQTFLRNITLTRRRRPGPRLHRRAHARRPRRPPPARQSV